MASRAKVVADAINGINKWDDPHLYRYLRQYTVPANDTIDIENVVYPDLPKFYTQIAGQGQNNIRLLVFLVYQEVVSIYFVWSYTLSPALSTDENPTVKLVNTTSYGSITTSKWLSLKNSSNGPATVWLYMINTIQY